MDTSHRAKKEESKADRTRYSTPNVQKKTEPSAAAKAKKLKTQQQQKPAGNQREPKVTVDPKAHYDTPRAQKQAADSSGHRVERVEMSQDKEVYEAMDGDRSSIYEETF